LKVEIYLKDEVLSLGLFYLVIPREGVERASGR
jgi:hypothetical protein